MKERKNVALFQSRRTKRKVYPKLSEKGYEKAVEQIFNIA